MQTILQDLRYGLRQLRRAPGFALTAVLTLALGIGANTAIFSLLDQALLRALPVRDPQQLVVLEGTGDAWEGSTSDHGGAEAAYFSYPMYRDLRDRDRAFEGLVATAPTDVGFNRNGSAQILRAELVSGNYFTTLGVLPATGRVFTQADDAQPGANPEAVLSYEFWRSGLNADPAVVGSTVSINSHPFVVVGVAAPGFRSAVWGETPSLFLPMSMTAEAEAGAEGRLSQHTFRWLNIVGRLRPGETAADAQAQSAPLWHALRAEELKALGTRKPHFVDEFLTHSRLLLKPAAGGFSYSREDLQQPLLAVMGMAALVLLIAVVNVGSLLLVRSAGRMREFSMRDALGASVARLLQQLVAEGLLLGVAGGLLGLLLAPIAIHAIVSRLAGSNGLARFTTALDARLLLFNFGIAVGFSLLFSLAPAVQLRRRTLNAGLRGSTTTSSGGLLSLRRTVVGLQIGLSLLLLVGAGLLVRTLKQLRATSAGFQTEHLVVFGLAPQLAGYAANRVPQVDQQLVAALAALPGVKAVGTTNDPELAGNDHGGNITLQNYTPAPEEEMSPEKGNVSPELFTALGMPLLAGRLFTAQDDLTHPLVAIVNESFAKRYFGSPQRALGQHLADGASNRPVFDTEIVGVVGNVRHDSLRAVPVPSLYRPEAQATGRDLSRELYFYTRSSLPSSVLFSAMRHAVAGVEPALALDDLRTMDEQIDASLQNERLIAMLATAFGSLAAALAGVGLYGVLAFVTAQRTREIGVRMALGASRWSVSRLVFADVLKMAVGGVVVGIPVAVFLARLLRSQLYNVSAADPLSIFSAAALLAVIALVASALPARRAASVNPTEALRTE